MARTLAELQQIPARMLEAVSHTIVGKDEAKTTLLVALLSGGHVLIEGMAGTAKTLLGRCFAAAFGGSFKRIQLTVDLLPTDVTGFYMYRADGSSQFVAGPIFAHVVLADELNRTTPRTQAAFLEAMQERQVTIEGTVHPLPSPFMVIASQVPTGSAGTYPLPDVQLDRFMFRVWSGYPAPDEEAAILGKIDVLEDPQIRPVATPEEVLAVVDRVRAVHVAEDVGRYMIALVTRVREDPDVLVGPSPRATIALYKGSRALAFLDGRDYVVPDDVKRLVPQALSHRIRLRPEAEMDGVTPDAVIDRALKDVPVPRPAVP